MERRIGESAKIKKYIRDAYGLDIVGCQKIDHGVMNRNFLVQDVSGRKLIFKIYEHKNSSTVAEEVRILNILRDKNFPCPRLVSDLSGSFHSEFFAKPSLLYVYIPGKTNVQPGQKIMSQLGALTGRLHLALRDENIAKRKGLWDLSGLKKILKDTGNFEKNGYPGADKLVFWTKENIKNLRFPSTLPKGFTHEDIKPENVVVSGGSVVGIVDFDNAYIGSLLSDVTTSIIWGCFKNGKFVPSLFEPFVLGYNSWRRFTDEEKKYFYEYLKFRLIREAFIGPFVTKNRHGLSKKRSDYFRRLLKNFDNVSNRVVIELILKKI